MQFSNALVCHIFFSVFALSKHKAIELIKNVKKGIYTIDKYQKKYINAENSLRISFEFGFN